MNSLPVDHLGPILFDWDDMLSLPEEWRDCLAPIEFEVPCSGVSHVVRWDTRQGAYTQAHGSAGDVVSALGGETPMCQRVVGVINGGSFRGRAGTLRRSTEDFFAAWEAADILRDLDDATVRAITSRSSKAGFLSALATMALERWLLAQGFAVYDGGIPDIAVKICKPDESNDVLGIGMQLAIGRGARTRAAVSILDSWYDTVRTHGFTVANRFLLGVCEQGFVCSQLGAHGGETEPVIGWGALLGQDPETQDMAALLLAANLQPSQSPDNSMFVCGNVDWDYDDERFTSREGVHPSIVVRNVRDARSWIIVTDFKGTFFEDNPVADYGIDDYDLPNSFNVDDDESNWHLLAACVADGVDPSFHTIAMGTYASVIDQRGL